MNRSYSALFFLLFVFTISTRLYGLNWGAPYYFHPDERNIAVAVTRLHFPENMNPHFFAYGTLPIYSIYTAAAATTAFLSLVFQDLSFDPFSIAIITSRFFSAIYAILLIPLIFSIGTKLYDKTTGLLAAAFAATSIGFIQYAHFGTFEMWMTYFSLIYFYVFIHALKNLSAKKLCILSLLVGILIAIKISASILFIPLLLLIIYQSIQSKHHRGKKIFNFFLSLSSSAFLITSITLISSPYTVLDFISFQNTIHYESSVALGTLPVFYTGEFFSTTPILFHFLHIYPFLLNPFILILLPPSIITIIFLTLKRKNKLFGSLLLFFIVLFFSQTFLFVKWIRYMVPTLPFIYLIIAIALRTWAEKSMIKKQYQYIFTSIVIGISLFYALSFFITTYIEGDTRLAANTWALQHIKQDATFLSEVYDMGIVAFNASFPNIKLFNFYDLDTGSPESSPQKLQQMLLQTDYIIFPSQRILKTRLRNPEKFPEGNIFYTQVFSNATMYEKVYQTPCSLFCKIVYHGNPVFQYEQTASVFDRPTLFIFKKR